MAKVSKQAKDDAIQGLRRLVRPGATVYGIVRSVSKSGMSRDISFLVIDDGEVFYLNWGLSNALGLPFVRGYHDAVKVRGAGMDMIYHVVDNLSHALGIPLRHRSL